MADITFPMINQHPVSWADITLQVGGLNLQGAEALRGFRAISYKTTVERSPVYGSGRAIIGYTKGKISHEASMTLIAETFEYLKTKLGAGFMDKSLNLTVSFKMGEVFHTREIVAAGMKEAGGDHQEGSEGLENVIPLDVISILYDSQSPTETTTL